MNLYANLTRFNDLRGRHDSGTVILVQGEIGEPFVSWRYDAVTVMEVCGLPAANDTRMPYLSVTIPTGEAEVKAMQALLAAGYVVIALTAANTEYHLLPAHDRSPNGPYPVDTEVNVAALHASLRTGMDDNVILLLHVGDFLEAYYGDAERVAEVCDLVLTSVRSPFADHPLSSDKRIPNAGIPYHSAEPYIKHLVDAGHAIAICNPYAYRQPFSLTF